MGTPFIGNMASFSQVYPEVEKIVVTYTESDAPYEKGPDEQGPVTIVGPSNFNPILPCCCRRCNKGGVSIEQKVRLMVSDKKTESNGEERCRGSISKDNPCFNMFIYHINISYKRS